MKATIILTLDAGQSFEVPLELARPLYENLRGLFERAPGPGLVDEPYADPEPEAPRKATKVTKTPKPKPEKRARAGGTMSDHVRAVLPKLSNPFRAKDVSARLPQYSRNLLNQALHRMVIQGEVSRTGFRGTRICPRPRASTRGAGWRTVGPSPARPTPIAAA